MDKWTELDEIEYQQKKKEFLLCLFLGWCGVHRFYKKKIGTGILYLCTFGCLLVGWIVDLLIATFQYQKLIDKKNSTGRSKKEIYERAKSLDQKELYRNTTRGYKKYCPSCGSDNCHAFVEDKVIRQGKTRIQTSVNLNPLKPFTLFNTKEKVVRNPLTMQVSKFVCDDCGKIFQ